MTADKVAGIFVRMGAEKIVDFREADPDCPIWNRKLNWLVQAYVDRQRLKLMELQYVAMTAGLGSDDPKWYNAQRSRVDKKLDRIDEILRPWIDPASRSPTSTEEDWSELSEDEAMELWGEAVGADFNDPEFDYDAEMEKALEELRANFPIESDLNDVAPGIAPTKR